MSTTMTYRPRLQKLYEEQIAPAIKEKFALTNVHQTPRLLKIVVNMGVGKAIENKKRLDQAMAELGQITGQKASLRRAKISVAGFKLRTGMPIGCCVTLRGQRMWDFADRLFTLALPRVRDFRGIKRSSFDGRGNFSMGVADQVVFPEIRVDKVENQQGMDVTFVVSGGSDAMSFELLQQLGLPFRKD
ncbi:MAG: 50S ribosomal protein L5 [Planctomycetota bacterium]